MEEFKANRKDNSVRQMPEVNAGVPEMVVNKKEIKAALFGRGAFRLVFGNYRV